MVVPFAVVKPVRLAFGWYGSARAGLLPLSWTGITSLAGTGWY